MVTWSPMPRKEGLKAPWSLLKFSLTHQSLSSTLHSQLDLFFLIKFSSHQRLNWKILHCSWRTLNNISSIFNILDGRLDLGNNIDFTHNRPRLGNVFFLKNDFLSIMWTLSARDRHSHKFLKLLPWSMVSSLWEIQWVRLCGKSFCATDFMSPLCSMWHH